MLNNKDIIILMALNDDLECLPGGMIVTASKFVASETKKVIQNSFNKNN
jgi:hypothetical protein